MKTQIAELSDLLSERGEELSKVGSFSWNYRAFLLGAGLVSLPFFDAIHNLFI